MDDDPREYKPRSHIRITRDLLELIQSVWMMQRGSSRRRKSRGDEVEESTGPSDGPGIRRACCSNGLGLYIPIVSVVFLVILWSWYTTPNGLPSIAVPGQNAHHTDHPISDSPDALRPQIRLHPESHTYRDPVTQYERWAVTADDLRPDGVLKRVYLINGTVFIAPRS